MTDVQRHEFPSWVKDMVAEVPGIQLDPIPHSVLPHPFEEYCLTPWIPSDVPQLVSIINHPESQMFGWRLNGGVAIDQDVMRKLEEGRTERWRHFPLCMLRRVDSLRDTEPETLGYFNLHPSGYRPFMEREVELREKNLDRPVEEREYNFAPLCDVKARGRGLSTAAINHQFKICPWLHRPGQVSGGWLVGNEASRRLHYKLGFRPIAKIDSVHAGHTGVLAIWMGLGDVTKEECIYAEMEDLGDVDIGPYAT